MGDDTMIAGLLLFMIVVVAALTKNQTGDGRDGR